ncbi:MAG: hypothetical protein JHC95_20885 [Solirubrobacteraceae bacterium]|nr:hypothetical protein [Solirubrobacteraceae bacterium]
MTAEEFVNAFAAAAGAPPPTEEQMGQLLDLAAVAAHSSERIAAPLCCYVAGVTGKPVEELLALVRQVAGDDAS